MRKLYVIAKKQLLLVTWLLKKYYLPQKDKIQSSWKDFFSVVMALVERISLFLFFFFNFILFFNQIKLITKYVLSNQFLDFDFLKFMPPTKRSRVRVSFAPPARVGEHSSSTSGPACVSLPALPANHVRVSCA